MEQRDMYLLLSSIYRIKNSEIEILKDIFGKLENLMKVDGKEILKIKNLNSKLLKNIVKYRSYLRIDKIKEFLYNNKIQYVCIKDKDYPSRLTHIYDPPPILFYKGDISFLEEEHILAVIGSRTPTQYGLSCVRKLARELSEAGVNIVSGLALGIDSEAHMACIKGKNGKTAAILGSPLDNIRPATNMHVAENILENGGVIISEYFLGSKVNPLNFVFRNRIISGLCEGILIVEAAKKSGALTTAKYATEQNKDVFAVPGPINSLKSEGCNELLKDGAHVVMKSEDILEYYKFFPLNNCKDSIEYDIKDLNCEKVAILDLIKKQGNVNIDDICNLTGINIKTINSNINELLIDDYIIEMENKTYGFNV